MKQGTLITKIVMFVLCGGVILYMAVYAARGLSGSLVTVVTYQDTLDDCAEITGIVVQEEVPLTGGAAIMDVLPEEGERVCAGEAVAVLYQSSEALDRKKQIQSLERELEQLQSALSSGGSLEDAAKLERQISGAILTLRGSYAAGDLSALEDNVLSLRTQVLQREFAYSASGDSSTVLAESVSSLTQQIAALQSQASYDTTSIYAPCSGIFSGMVDGLGSVLSPEALETISAGQLAAVSTGTSPVDTGGIGKLITGERWYFAAVVDSSIASRLQPGDRVTAAFSRDFAGEVSMRVERVGREEAEGCVLVLSSNHNLRDVTLLRDQTISLIFQRFTGIRVPKQALRMETQTATNSDTGEETQRQALGVYAVVGGRAKFKEVEIVREGSDCYLVSPIKTSDGVRLRAGEQIVVTAPDLYDGKVVLS